MKFIALCVALSACGVEDPELDSVQTDLQQEAELYCPGVLSSEVTTYRGLTGIYRRMTATAVGEPLKLTLFAYRDDPDARGTFSGYETGETGLPAPYGGNFAAIPDNPAIGAAFVLDTNSDGEYDKLYFVLGMTRAFGLVQNLCMIGGDHPFVMQRSLY
ncbi:MAG TPA: hypothetical protein VIV40_29255 [Kofleriaceae bacterium]